MTLPDPWADFWTGDGDGPPASLNDLPPDARASLDAPFRSLARALPHGARVLDLATGGGIVLRLLAAARPDLRLTGVDAAANLPVVPGIELKPRVRIEQLPFPDSRFHAVTSRFGIEYGDVAVAGREIERVLRPDGTVTIVAHHQASPVLSHNLDRLAALRWAALESGWIDKAMNLAAGRRIALLPTPAALRAAPDAARERYPRQPVAWEFLTGMVQVLDLRAAMPGDATRVALERLNRLAAGEIGRLEALAGAARDAGDMDRLEAHFSKAGIQLDARTVLPGSGDAPLAWLLEGRKA